MLPLGPQALFRALALALTLAVLPAAVVAPPAHAAGPIISGIAVDSVTGDPLPGIDVVAQRLESGVPTGPSFPAETGADGRYSVTGDLHGYDYRVEFRDPDGSHANLTVDLDDVYIDAIASAAMKPMVALTGTIKDAASEEPIPGANAVAFEANDSGDGDPWTWVNFGEADETGAYELRVPVNGTYRIKFESVTHQTEFWNNAATIEDATDVVVDTDPISDRDAELSPPVVNVDAPTITGTPLSGEILTADAGTWDPADAIVELQWLRDGSEISGATGGTHQLGAADVGARISVRVTASKDLYWTTSVESEPTDRVAEHEFEKVGEPEINGTPQVGETLTVSPGMWEPADASLEFQWHRDGSTIPGATGPTYEPGASDLGARLSVEVTASKAGYESASATSSATAPVSKGVMAMSKKPKVKGKLKVGKKLKAKAKKRKVTPTPAKVKYKWFVNGNKVKGKAGKRKKFVLEPWMRGAKVKVKIVYKLPGYEKLKKKAKKRGRVR